MSASILIADDEVGIRDLLNFELSSEGFEVTVAVDGAAAIAQARSQEFDLIISDVRMPGASGIDLLRAVKASDPHTEVIIMTAFGDLDCALECLRAGASDFVAKPFDVMYVVNRVRIAIERKRLRTENALVLASQAILHASDPRDLPRTIVETAGRALNADHAALMLVGDRDQLYVAHSYHREGCAIEAPLELASAQLATGSSTATLVGDSLIHPLLIGTVWLGALTFTRRDAARPYRQGDLQAAGVLAAEIQLALQNARLVEKLLGTDRLAWIGQLAAMIAHEINNPLVSVIVNQDELRERWEAFAELGAWIEQGAKVEDVREWWAQLEGPKVIEEGREAFEYARAGVARIREVVRDMQMASNPSTHVDLVDLGDLLRTAIRLSGVSRSGAEITTRLPPGLRLRGNSSTLVQMFVNMLVNASQAMTGAAVRTLRIEARCEAGDTLVEIEDSGCGIAVDALPHIFEPFFTTKPGGTGLGLSMSRDLLRSLGAGIDVQTKLGAGTTMTVRFPDTAEPYRAAG